MSNWTFLVIAFLMPNLLGAQSWEILNIPPAARYDDVFFLDDQKGWACNSEGRIYQTLDGGDSWHLQFDNGNYYLRSIEFLNDSVGFCGGLDFGYWLYRTTDGGQTWNSIVDQIPGLPGGICGLACPGNNVVYGCGRWNKPAYVIKSIDGGQTWVLKDMSAWANKLVDVFFVSPDSGWVSGTAADVSEGGIILSTSDGGDTWHIRTKTNISSDIVWKIQTPDSLHFFASIERFASGQTTQILKSTDGGVNWSLRTVYPVSNRLQMVGFLDPQTGWCGNDALFGTQDGSDTWTKLTNPGVSLNRFWRINSNLAIVTGGQVYRLSRINTSQAEPVLIEAVEPCRFFVSPNPGNGVIRIEVDMTRATSTWLAFTRLDGRGPIQTLWEGEHPAGQYTIRADLSPYGAGIYVVWLKTNFGTVQEIVTVLDR